MKFRIKNYKITKLKTKAFTLVEVLVSVSLFVMAIVALSQVYISIIRSERIAYALLNSENNIRNSLEVMARSIRLGKNFEILPDNKRLCFDYYLEGAWEGYCYRFNVDDYTLEKLSKDGSYVSMLDPSLKVNYGQFYNKGGLSDSQSVIIIVLEVSTSVRQQQYLFNLQTAITPRYLGGEI
ncbi:MAG: prepilin-type N-terminal cleavage/methylation domain-containing protein [Candidatus Pacebacteria bacterium]|nr:prepilin-type N-terminal cleavage/methylation domain-containing protein [Candidatus Paceibacterota bacterium]